MAIWCVQNSAWGQDKTLPPKNAFGFVNQSETENAHNAEAKCKAESVFVVACLAND